MKTHQENIFDYQSPVKIPDFDGDFEKEMDWISSLPEEEWLQLFKPDKKEDQKWLNQK